MGETWLLSQLTIDPEVQQRADLNLFAVAEYAEAMQNGATFPPLIAYHDGTTCWLSEGFHRIAAAQRIGWTEFPVEIRPGSKRDAILNACGSNAEHGLRRTNADKKRAALTLLNDPEWSQWSDSEIARRCGVSQQYVSILRKELSYNDCKIETARLVKRNGTTYTMNTAGIGAVETLRHTPVADNPAEIKELLKQPEEKQQEIAERIASGEAKTVREAKTLRRREEREEMLLEAASHNEPLSVLGQRFPVLYADPPWRYEHVKEDRMAIENQYPTMALDDICALPVGAMATDAAILYLWSTSPKLTEAMRVIDAWGFTYRTCLVWVKESIGPGYWARQRHELLLVATRGEMLTPAPANRPDSVIEAPRGKHSEKPERAYELIEAMYPTLPKVELFARQPRAGWMAWGNEVVLHD